VKYQAEIAKVYDGPKFTGPIEVQMFFDEDGVGVVISPFDPVFEKPTKLRGDIDNYVKTVLDGLNDVAFDDDAQVMKITATKA
jgi:Holliday junction resolvase RusA-like endonuclease